MATRKTSRGTAAKKRAPIFKGNVQYLDPTGNVATQAEYVQDLGDKPNGYLILQTLAGTSTLYIPRERVILVTA